jgi:hypothetical protein
MTPDGYGRAMPTAKQKRRRGGVVKVRTIEGPKPGTYRRIYIMRRPGPRGGRTLSGEIQTKKSNGR